MALLAILQLVAVGILLGLSIAAPPGPINATIAAQAARSWRAAASVGAGAITADLTFFGITYMGLTALVKEALSPLLFLGGGAIMLYMAYSTFRARGRGSPHGGPMRGRGTPYLIGLSIGITNPFQIAWWMTVGLAVVATYGLGILAGFFLGISGWVVAYTTVLRAGAVRYEGAYVAVTYLSVAVLTAFGVWFILSALAALL